MYINKYTQYIINNKRKNTHFFIHSKEEYIFANIVKDYFCVMLRQLLC